MHNLIHKKAAMSERLYENSFASAKGAKTNGGISMPIKNPDTMLGTIVLLLACLALAALAYVIV